ncbi:MAG: toxin-antitoxin system protein [Lachnospiraceae bacterium]|nr:toxin-antitoxin system protein [Lachnospiraceae bacterium]
MKTKVNISLDADTAKKMKELAENSHKNVSQWVSDKVWETAKKEEMEQAKLQKLKGTE